MRECDVISQLWIQLNPHAQVHGCEVDSGGTVHIWILYLRAGQQNPLELVLGNPASTVIRGLRKAANEAARQKRLTVSGSRLIQDDKPAGGQRTEKSEE